MNDDAMKWVEGGRKFERKQAEKLFIQFLKLSSM